MIDFDSDLFERLFEEVEDDVSPIQLIVGGLFIDVAKIHKPLVLPGASADNVMITTELRDGRLMNLRASAIQGYVVGRAWE